jgi:hypothetical protein
LKDFVPFPYTLVVRPNQRGARMADFDKVHQLLDQIGEERAKGRMARRAFTAGFLLIFVIFFGNLYSKITGFDVDSFMVELQNQAATTVWPVYSAQLKGVADDAVPAISDALAAEAAELLPKVSDKLTAEAEVFQNNMGEYMKVSLDKEFLAASEGKKDELSARFPRFAENPDAYEELMVRLQTSARIWAQTQLDTTFEQHVALLQSINDTVKVLQVQAAGERSKTGDRSMEDVLFLMSDIFNTRVAGEG